MSSPWKWWIAIAGTALVVGGIAWILKLWVIIATDGRVVATGAAGAFFSLGLFSLLVGSTGVGLWLAMNQERSMRITLAVVFPFVFIGAFGVFSGIGYALLAIGDAIVGVAVPGYLFEEGGIFITAVVGLVLGIWLVVGVPLRGGPDGTRAASGSLEAEPRPRVR